MMRRSRSTSFRTSSSGTHLRQPTSAAARRGTGKRKSTKGFRYFPIVAVLLAVNLYIFYFQSKISLPALRQEAVENVQNKEKVKALANGSLQRSSKPARSKIKNTYASVQEIKCSRGVPLEQSLSKAGIKLASKIGTLLKKITTDAPESGSRLFAYYNAQRTLVALDYHYSSYLGGHLERQQGNVFELELRTGKIEKKPEVVTVSIEGSFEQSLLKRGEEPLLASMLQAQQSGLLAEGLQPGDEISIVVEKIFLKKFWRYEKILAIEHRRGNKATALFYFSEKPGKPGNFYHENGSLNGSSTLKPAILRRNALALVKNSAFQSTVNTYKKELQTGRDSGMLGNFFSASGPLQTE